MSIIIIKDMDMPKTCDDCLSGFVQTIHCNKRQFFFDRDKMRHPDCPLHEFPDRPEIDLERLEGCGFEI